MATKAYIPLSEDLDGTPGGTEVNPSDPMPTEDTPILVEDDHKRGSGTIPSSVFNLVNTIIGGGILALPYAMMNMGIVLGLLTLVAFALMTSYTGDLIVRCGYPPISAGFSYADMMTATFGRYGKHVFNVMVIIFLSGALIGYMVIVGQVLSPYVNKLFDIDRRLVILIMGLGVMFPLINLKRINALRFTSVAALILITYMLGCIVVKSITNLRTGIDNSKIKLARFHSGTFSVLPVISFAFTFHANITAIWRELREPTLRNIRISVLSSTFVCAIVYGSAGVFGYLSFLEDTTDNILEHYHDDLALDIGKVGYSLIICFSYPVLAYPLRQALNELLFPNNLEETRLRIFLMACCIFVVSYVLGITIPKIGIVFGLTGSTAGTCIVLLFPCLMYMHLKVSPLEGQADSRHPWWVYRYLSKDKIAPLIISIVSVVLGIVGTWAVIDNEILPLFGIDESSSASSSSVAT